MTSQARVEWFKYYRKLLGGSRKKAPDSTSFTPAVMTEAEADEMFEVEEPAEEKPEEIAS